MSKKIKVRKGNVDKEIAQDDLIKVECLTADYVDSYIFELETPKELDAKALQRAIWANQPKIVETMMQLRDKLVKPFGLKGGNPPVEEWLAQGQYQKICDSEKQIEEMMLAEDDHHLKFILSIKIISEQSNKKQVTATTVVYFHNRLGKFYFTLIRPFHGLLVPLAIRHILKQYL